MCIGLYRDVWIAAIASSRTSLATQTAAICGRFQRRCVHVTMQVTFLTRKSALIYRRGLRQRVGSLTLDCNGVFAIKACAIGYQTGKLTFNTLSAKDGDLRLSASNACLPKTEISVFVTECVFFTSTCYKLHIMFTLHDVLYS